MFSKELVSFVVNYIKEKLCQSEENTVKEIRFKDNYFTKLAYATVVVKR